MKHTICALVENHAGVLSRVSGLFSRRGYNIESLAVGITDDPLVSRITIVTSGDAYIIEQITKQLNKLIDVIIVKTFVQEEILSYELFLLKIAVTASNYDEIIAISKVLNCEIVDSSLKSITLKMTGDNYLLARAKELLSPYKILEIIRTGTVSIQKGENTLRNF